MTEKTYKEIVDMFHLAQYSDNLSSDGGYVIKGDWFESICGYRSYKRLKKSSIRSDEDRKLYNNKDYNWPAGSMILYSIEEGQFEEGCLATRKEDGIKMLAKRLKEYKELKVKKQLENIEKDF
jgi:hypothetical protein